LWIPIARNHFPDIDVLYTTGCFVAGTQYGIVVGRRLDISINLIQVGFGIGPGVPEHLRGKEIVRLFVQVIATCAEEQATCRNRAKIRYIMKYLHYFPD